jgi:hypothetical protein
MRRWMKGCEEDEEEAEVEEGRRMGGSWLVIRCEGLWVKVLKG